MQRLLNVKEVAEILGLETSTIYDWVYHRKIDYVKVGRLLKFTPEVVQNFIETHTTQGSFY